MRPSALAASGEHRAFAELVRRRQGMVRGLMRRLCGDPSLAEDLRPADLRPGVAADRTAVRRGDQPLITSSPTGVALIFVGLVCLRLLAPLARLRL